MSPALSFDAPDEWEDSDRKHWAYHCDDEDDDCGMVRVHRHACTHACRHVSRHDDDGTIIFAFASVHAHVWARMCACACANACACVGARRLHGMSCDRCVHGGVLCWRYHDIICTCPCTCLHVCLCTCLRTCPCTCTHMPSLCFHTVNTPCLIVCAMCTLSTHVSTYAFAHIHAHVYTYVHTWGYFRVCTHVRTHC